MTANRRKRVLYIPRAKIYRNRLVRMWRTLAPHYLNGMDSSDAFFYLDAFFYGGLHAAFNVTETDFNNLVGNKMAARKYDYIVVNHRCARGGKIADYGLLSQIADVDVPKILVSIDDKPWALLKDDRTFDLFSAVFKREPYKDRDRYDTSSRNKDKLHATMLACPLVRAKKPKDLSNPPVRESGFAMPALEAGSELFFSGRATSVTRIEAMRRLAREGFDVAGSLSGGKFAGEVDEALRGPPLSPARFVRAARAARINLALEGGGPFTHRHLEFWCLCCFFLSPAAIAELETPIPYEDGKHYVGFEDIDDLVDKCRYYLGAEAERLKIAQAGRRLFEEYYSFEKHGQQIEAVLDRL